MSQTDDPLFDVTSDGWSRRRFLEAAGVGAVGAGLALAGCSSGDSKSNSGGTSASGTEKPQRGGTLTFGTVTTGSDSIDGQAAFGVADWARSYALYSGLARIDQQGQVKLWMAESIEPNKDATQWEIKIPSGITTHNGKSFTSKDVLYSLKRMVGEKTFGSNALGPKMIDFAASKTVDDTTLLVAYKQPFSQLVEALAVIWNVMVPEGFDPKKPDGTGPFKLKSFTAGGSAVVTRFENYWENGKPYLDELVIEPIKDETAQVNALQSGQVDLINYLSAASIGTLESSGQKTYIANETGGAFCFTMRMDMPPFNDARVRQAFRLIIDRPAMLRQVYGEYGSVGNDLFNPRDPYYDTSIPQRQQDIEQAKSLLAKAGKSGMTIDLYMSPDAAPGATQASQVFATQARAAGVNMKVVTQTSTQYFEKSYGTVPLMIDFWMTIPYLIEAGMAVGPQPAFNVTHQDIPQWNKLWTEALQTTDKSKQKDLVHELQQIDHTEGGNIIPMFFPGLDASTQNVMGIQPSAAATGPNAFYWADVWKKS